MNRTSSTISVRWTCRTTGNDMDAAQLKRLARRVCRQFGIRRAEVNIAAVNDKIIRALHSKFLGSDKVTDVISFDLSESLKETKYFDIIINAEEARRQAAVRGHSMQAEMALYLVHGLLHQLGFDDGTAAGAREMHRQEDKILEETGFGNVYHSTRKG